MRWPWTKAVNAAVDGLQGRIEGWVQEYLGRVLREHRVSILGSDIGAAQRPVFMDHADGGAARSPDTVRSLIAPVRADLDRLYHHLGLRVHAYADRHGPRVEVRPYPVAADQAVERAVVAAMDTVQNAHATGGRLEVKLVAEMAAREAVRLVLGQNPPGDISKVKPADTPVAPSRDTNCDGC